MRRQAPSNRLECPPPRLPNLCVSVFGWQMIAGRESTRWIDPDREARGLTNGVSQIAVELRRICACAVTVQSFSGARFHARSRSGSQPDAALSLFECGKPPQLPPRMWNFLSAAPAREGLRPAEEGGTALPRNPISQLKNQYLDDGSKQFLHLQRATDGNGATTRCGLRILRGMR